MDPFLKDKIAIVTGGSRGIGRAIAEKLASAGARVAICGQSEPGVLQALEQMRVSGCEVIGKAADVSNKEDVIGFFRYVDEKLGAADILVNNAGIGRFAPVSKLSFQDWKRTLDVNLTGTFLCSQEALSRFETRRGGYIINVSSLAGKNPFAGGAAYCASKFGLNGFTESMMLDHRYDGVRVSTIMPGSVDTGFGPSGGVSADWKIAPEDVAEMVLAILRMPMRTLVSAVEMRPSKPRK
jgi:NAD(P)-dependent dehydrogenase (short-subunit alcohol dehydrogenase family)